MLGLGGGAGRTSRAQRRHQRGRRCEPAVLLGAVARTAQRDGVLLQSRVRRYAFGGGAGGAAVLGVAREVSVGVDAETQVSLGYAGQAVALGVAERASGLAGLKGRCAAVGEKEADAVRGGARVLVLVEGDDQTFGERERNVVERVADLVADVLGQAERAAAGRVASGGKRDRAVCTAGDRGLCCGRGSGEARGERGAGGGPMLWAVRLASLSMRSEARWRRSASSIKAC